MEAATAFLAKSPHLGEVRAIVNQGGVCPTKVGDKTLVGILQNIATANGNVTAIFHIFKNLLDMCYVYQ